ncbi:MAG: ABC transporter ATP-binding protein [Planctomycetota bacterium]
MTTKTDQLVHAEGLGKCFRLYDRPLRRLADLLLGAPKDPSKQRFEEHWGLRSVDLTIAPGECLGVIGKNGSGKSTLLKLLSGALSPTEGSVRLGGRCLALIELATGFDPRLTGRENIRFVGEMLGLGTDYVQSRESDILEFAGLGMFIDQPTRSYSSGMFARLSFSLFAFLDPDVLMVDEVLAVGDAEFKQRCYSWIETVVERGDRALLYVSHGLETVQRLATRVLWLDQGQVRELGDPSTVLENYRSSLTKLP